jgi:hypothetical protein
MSRSLGGGLVSELTAATLRPFLLFEGVFASSTLRLWTGVGDLSWNGFTWLGNGWIEGFSNFTENNEIRTGGVDIVLSGVPAALVSLILTEARHDSRGSVYLGSFNSSGAIASSPYLLFEGALSAPRIDDSGDATQVVLSYEDDLIMLARSKELRWNNESQQAIFPGDKGFEYVAAIQKWTGFWGAKEKPKPPEPPKKKKKGRK